MNRQQLNLLVIALVLIGGTAFGMSHLKAIQRLGAPGVKSTPIPGDVRVNIFLPETAGGYDSVVVPTDTNMVTGLPQDTSFMQRRYTPADATETNSPLGHIALDVVLMGTDRTSIHKPQFCLTGQGWPIDSAESGVETIRIEKPYPYDLQVMKLWATREVNNGERIVRYRGLYVYWFIADHDLTCDHSTRMWHSVKRLVGTGELERWAYVSYFSICRPGEEQETYEKTKKFIAATVPEFQLATNPKAAVSTAALSRNNVP
jgi:hypothetical protein